MTDEKKDRIPDDRQKEKDDGRTGGKKYRML